MTRRRRGVFRRELCSGRGEPTKKAELYESLGLTLPYPPQLKQAKEIIDLALDLARDCAASYRVAKPEVRKMWNQAFFHTIRVSDGRIEDFTYEEPFASLLGSHKSSSGR